MHLLLLFTVFSLAWWLRSSDPYTTGCWEDRWQQTLRRFMFSPLLLLSTAIAVICMGPHGQMVLPWEGWFSYGLATVFLIYTAFLGGKLFWRGIQILRQVRAHPLTQVKGHSIRLLNIPLPYIAQVGFWQPELVISQGLFETLTDPHLNAVLVHEQAHCHYRDTFWFFWLGWVHRITAWLPHSQALWEELLVLRELRADRWASQQADTLLLAEALLLVVKSSPFPHEDLCVAFNSMAPANRLTQRIEALLSEAEPPCPISPWSWSWLPFTLLPLLVIPLHS